MDQVAGALWLIAVPGGTLVLGLALLFGWLQWRRRNRRVGYTAEGGKPGRPEATVERRHQAASQH
jgi:uncharacterized protein (TIGR03382 family)